MEGNFEELWGYQKGALFLKQDMIYDLRKDLAEYFYNAGLESAQKEIEQLKSDIKEREFTAKYHLNFVKKQEKEIELLLRVVKLQSEALEYYSDETDDGLDWSGVNNFAYIQDKGKLARQTLATTKEMMKQGEEK